jgi:hypothetical protein
MPVADALTKGDCHVEPSMIFENTSASSRSAMSMTMVMENTFAAKEKGKKLN